ncbi:MAG: hypothetical protein K0S91_2594 [Nitrososphaeraceae archaeon]|nr:hypothetical protein [Nitrososphaeraceae archaeon]
MIFYIFILLINNSFLTSFVCLFKCFSENSIRHFSSNQTKMILGILCCLACLILKQLYILSNQNDKIEFDITANGCNTEAIDVSNGTAYLLSCKKCDKILGIVSEPK